MSASFDFMALQTAKSMSSRDEVKECFFCHVEEADTDRKMRRCSGCQIANYCSVDCQKKGWRGHKTVCKLLSRNKEAQKTEVIALVNFSRPLKFKSQIRSILKISQQEASYKQFLEYIKENVENQNSNAFDLCHSLSDSVKCLFSDDLIEILEPFYGESGKEIPFLYMLFGIITRYEKLVGGDDFCFKYLHRTVDCWLDSFDFAFSHCHMLDVSTYICYCPVEDDPRIGEKLNDCFRPLSVDSSICAISSLSDSEKVQYILNMEGFLGVLKEDYIFPLHRVFSRINEKVSGTKRIKAKFKKTIALANREINHCFSNNDLYDEKLKWNLIYVIEGLENLKDPARKGKKKGHNETAPRGWRSHQLNPEAGRVLVELKDKIIDNVFFILSNYGPNDALVVKKIYKQLLEIAKFRAGEDSNVRILKPIYYVNTFIRIFVLTSLMRIATENKQVEDLFSEMGVLEMVYNYFYDFAKREVNERFAEAKPAQRKEYLFYIMHLLKERLGSIPGGDYYDRFMQMGIMPREVEGHMNEELNALADELISQIESPQTMVKFFVNKFNDPQRSIADLVEQHFDLLMHYGIISEVS